jgi:hypothetical protein
MSVPHPGVLKLVPDIDTNEGDFDDFAEIALDGMDGDASLGTGPGASVANTDADETNTLEGSEAASENASRRKKGFGQPGRSGPPGNRNAARHGHYSLKRAVQERGLEAIDGRSALGRALREFRNDLIRDLGGEANLSTAELHLIDLAVRDRLFLESLDAALADRPLLNRKRGSVAPALEARFRMADSATRRLQALGLKRRTRRKTVNEIIAEIHREAEISSATDDGDADDGREDEN